VNSSGIASRIVVHTGDQLGGCSEKHKFCKPVQSCIGAEQSLEAAMNKKYGLSFAAQESATVRGKG